ncbi:MAG: ROK family protein [Planctomycetota bacterium]
MTTSSSKPATTGALPKTNDGPCTLTVDIGGTGIKMLPIDPNGQPKGDRVRELTPVPAPPSAVMDVIGAMLAEQANYDRVSVGFPGVVLHGVVRTAPNLGTEAWRNFDLQRAVATLAGKPTRVLNDADLQGYGVIHGRGVELVFTLGTGLGTALFTDGRLIPNVEIGHHPVRKKLTYEQLVSNAMLERVGKKQWRENVWEVVASLEPIFNFETLHIGGGNAKKLKGPFPPNVRIFDSAEGLAGGVRLWRDL